MINATSGVGAMSALEHAGAEALGEKILIDASNPLDFSKGVPWLRMWGALGSPMFNVKIVR